MGSIFEIAYKIPQDKTPEETQLTLWGISEHGMPEYRDGYFELKVAEDVVIPTYMHSALNAVDDGLNKLASKVESIINNQRQTYEKQSTGYFLPVTVHTGLKANLSENQILLMSLSDNRRNLVLTGSNIVSKSHYNNPYNDGEIVLNVYNMSAYMISLKKGDVIAKAIIVNTVGGKE